MKERPLMAICCAGALLVWTGDADAFALQAGDSMLPAPILRLVAAFAICTLAAVMAALALKAWLRHRAGAASPGMFTFARKTPSGLSVLETRQLSPGALVTRIAYDDLEFLVLVSGQSASVLHQKTVAPPNAL